MRCPMPCRFVPGGQGRETLAVIEAMKMDKYPARRMRDGTIENICVKPGDGIAVDAVMEFA